VGERVIRASGLLLAVGGAAFIVWIYARQPQTIEQVTGGLASGIGAYRIDQASFDDALTFFRNEQFPEARAAFERADPAQRDARTQFYIAYSYYRQGWGRVYNDNDLFARGIEAVDRATALAPGGRLRVDDDPDLQMHSGDELKAELERGRAVDASDFNPMRVFRKRK
jgi:hypothetical protein